MASMQHGFVAAPLQSVCSHIPRSSSFNPESGSRDVQGFRILSREMLREPLRIFEPHEGYRKTETRRQWVFEGCCCFEVIYQVNL